MDSEVIQLDSARADQSEEMKSKADAAKVDQGAAKSARKAKAKASGGGEQDTDYATGDYVVYPTHGVGRVTGIETQDISGISLRLISIKFEKDRMTLRVPVEKAHNSGLRKLSTRKVLDDALHTLKGKSRVRRTMWSRAAPKSTRPRSTRATRSPSPRLCATSTAAAISPSSPIANGRCIRRQWTVWRASSRPSRRQTR